MRKKRNKKDGGMEQQVLLVTSESAHPRQCRTHTAAPPPLWTGVEHPWDEAIRRDRELRGTGRAREQTFRAALWTLTARHAEAMPPRLSAAVLDHLTRTDGQGLSLCFHGPLREALLADVFAWVDARDVEAGQSLRQQLAYNEEAL